MPFKVKNLMVSVLPQETDLQIQQTANLTIQWTGPIYTLTQTWTPTYPTYPTLPPWTCLTSTVPTCGLSTRPPGTFSWACGPIDIGDIEVLNQMKAQLDAQINAVNANLAPKTLEEADMLEKHLTEALNEVKATKEALRKAK